MSYDSDNVGSFFPPLASVPEELRVIEGISAEGKLSLVEAQRRGVLIETMICLAALESSESLFFAPKKTDSHVVLAEDLFARLPSAANSSRRGLPFWAKESGKDRVKICLNGTDAYPGRFPASDLAREIRQAWAQGSSSDFPAVCHLVWNYFLVREQLNPQERGQWTRARLAGYRALEAIYEGFVAMRQALSQTSLLKTVDFGTKALGADEVELTKSLMRGHPVRLARRRGGTRNSFSRPNEAPFNASHRSVWSSDSPTWVFAAPSFQIPSNEELRLCDLLAPVEPEWILEMCQEKLSSVRVRLPRYNPISNFVEADCSATFWDAVAIECREARLPPSEATTSILATYLAMSDRVGNVALRECNKTNLDAIEAARGNIPKPACAQRVYAEWLVKKLGTVNSLLNVGSSDLALSEDEVQALVSAESGLPDHLEIAGECFAIDYSTAPHPTLCLPFMVGSEVLRDFPKGSELQLPSGAQLQLRIDRVDGTPSSSFSNPDVVCELLIRRYLDEECNRVGRELGSPPCLEGTDAELPGVERRVACTNPHNDEEVAIFIVLMVSLQVDDEQSMSTLWVWSADEKRAEASLRISRENFEKVMAKRRATAEELAAANAEAERLMLDEVDTVFPQEERERHRR